MLETEKYKKPCLRVPVSPSTVKNGVILNLAEASGRGTKWREISEIMPPNISPPPPPTPTPTESFPKQMCFARKVIFRHRRIFHSLPVCKSFSKQKCRKRKKHIKVLAAVDLQFFVFFQCCSIIVSLSLFPSFIENRNIKVIELPEGMKLFPFPAVQ